MSRKQQKRRSENATSTKLVRLLKKSKPFLQKI